MYVSHSAPSRRLSMCSLSLSLCVCVCSLCSLCSMCAVRCARALSVPLSLFLARARALSCLLPSSAPHCCPLPVSLEHDTNRLSGSNETAPHALAPLAPLAPLAHPAGTAASKRASFWGLRALRHGSNWPWYAQAMQHERNIAGCNLAGSLVKPCASQPIPHARTLLKGRRACAPGRERPSTQHRRAPHRQARGCS